MIYSITFIGYRLAFGVVNDGSFHFLRTFSLHIVENNPVFIACDCSFKKKNGSFLLPLNRESENEIVSIFLLNYSDSFIQVLPYNTHMKYVEHFCNVPCIICIIFNQHFNLTNINNCRPARIIFGLPDQNFHF